MFCITLQDPTSGVQEPQIPAADFKGIAEETTVGLERSGFFKLIWSSLGDAMSFLMTKAIFAFLALGVRIALFFGDAITEAENTDQQAFAKLAASAVEDVFDIKVDQDAFLSRNRKKERVKVAAQIGSQMINQLIKQADVKKGVTPEPSAKAAELFVGTVVKLHLEGWLSGWIAEAVTAGQLETFGELDDKLARSMGLNFLSRRALAPLFAAIMADPMRWHVAKTYRSKLLGTTIAAKQFIRGRWSREQMVEELARQGLSDERIEAVVNNAMRFLGFEDVGYLVRNEFWTHEQGIQHLRDSGYTEEMAEATLVTELNRRLDTLRGQMTADSVRAFVAHELDQAELDSALAAAGVPELERRVTVRAAGLRRELKVRRLSLGDIEKALKEGLVTLEEYREYLSDRGYPQRDQQVLIQLILVEIAKKEAGRVRTDTTQPSP